MCQLLVAVDPVQEVVPGNHVGLAQNLTGQIALLDGPAQGVLADVDTGSSGTLHGLLHVQHIQGHHIYLFRFTSHLCFSSIFFRIVQAAA